MRRLRQRLGLFLDVVLVVALEYAFKIFNRGFDRVALGLFDLVAVLLQRLAHAVDHGVGLVARLDEFLGFMVFLGVRLGVLDHLLDFRLGQAGTGLDDDLVFLAGALVFGRDVQDAVGVDVERHLDLRHAARRRRDAGQVETAERFVAHGHFALALKHVHRHRALVFVRGREHLRGLGRDRGVFLDQLGHDTAERLDAERQRRDVEQQHVLHVAAEHTALDRGTDRHGFVRVDVLARLLAEEIFHDLLNFRHARLTTDENHVVNLRDRQPGILKRDFARLNGAGDEVLDQRLELGARELDSQMLRPLGVGGDVRQVDVGLLVRRQFDLGLLGRVLQALQRQRVRVQVDALVLLEFVHEMVDDALVEVLAAEEGIAVGREHLELVLAVHVGDLDDGNIERTAAEVVHRDFGVAGLLVHAVGERRRRRLVDDALHVEAGDAAGVLGRLALRVVEVRRHGDHCFGDLFAEIILGGLFHLLQHARGNFRRRHLLGPGLDPGIAVLGLHDLVRHELDVALHHVLAELAPDQALDGVERVGRVGNRLALGRLADHDLIVVAKRDDGRRGAVALAVLDNLDLVALHHRHAGVRRAQVNADDLCHVPFL